MKINLPDGLKCEQLFIDPETLLSTPDPFNFTADEKSFCMHINGHYATFFLLVNRNVDSSTPMDGSYRMMRGFHQNSIPGPINLFGTQSSTPAKKQKLRSGRSGKRAGYVSSAAGGGAGGFGGLDASGYVCGVSASPLFKGGISNPNVENHNESAKVEEEDDDISVTLDSYVEEVPCAAAGSTYHNAAAQNHSE